MPETLAQMRARLPAALAAQTYDIECIGMGTQAPFVNKANRFRTASGLEMTVCKVRFSRYTLVAVSCSIRKGSSAAKAMDKAFQIGMYEAQVCANFMLQGAFADLAGVEGPPDYCVMSPLGVHHFYHPKRIPCLKR